MNFGVRSVVGAEVPMLVENYFQAIFNLTIASYQSNLPNKQKTMDELMTHINQVWQRFMFETVQLKSESQQKMEEYISQIITTQIDENLNCQSKDPDLDDNDHQSDGSEDFEKTQKTIQADSFDWFSKLMRQKVDFSIPILLDRFN